MKLRRLLLASVFVALAPFAAFGQTQGSTGPTPPANVSPPPAPLGGCFYMPNGTLIGASGSYGLTCGANGGLNVNVLTGGGGGGGGGSVTQGTSPWVDNITQWASIALGAPTNYGTAPTGIVPGVNSFITNFPASQPVTGAFFQSIQPVSGTVTANQGTAGATPWPTTDSNAANTIGNAGATSLKAQSVQGIPGGTAVPVSGIVTNNPSTGATLTTSQPSVTTTAAALTFAGTVHREIFNPAASTASIFIGATGVTTATGFEIPPGASYDISRFTGSVFAIAASAQTVRLISY